VPEEFALAATSEVVLAHVLTGDPEVDELARAGLLGLSNTLWQRTAVEPAAPMGVDIEADELAFFPSFTGPSPPTWRSPRARPTRSSTATSPGAA
jgi:hypothetical protein